MLRHALIVAATVAISAPVFAATASATAIPAELAEVHGTKAKPTKASVTALKVKLEKARDAMRTLAKQAAPSALSVAQKKAYAAEMTKLTALADGTDLVVKDLDAKLSEAKPKLDTLSDMGDQQSLKLQMEMDRMAKAFTLLSNMLKKQSDTASTIIDNLK